MRLERWGVRRLQGKSKRTEHVQILSNVTDIETDIETDTETDIETDSETDTETDIETDFVN